MIGRGSLRGPPVPPQAADRPARTTRPTRTSVFVGPPETGLDAPDEAFRGVGIDSLDTVCSVIRIDVTETEHPGELVVQTTLLDDTREFRAPQTMTPTELGDSLARLVWESFSDFLAREDVETPVDVDALYDDERRSRRTAEEALIFFLWAHTRGAQLAFMGRAPEDRIREGLDALHRAVFEDMVQHGTPSGQLPLFEQRVSARYAEYNHAAGESDERLGAAVGRHLVGDAKRGAVLADAIRERAIAVANPLKDFLEEVELVAG
jgi:hypothetical protein